MLFRHRVDAGLRLATKLEHLRPQRPIVVALPRGGVPVAQQIARALEAPLDILVARKIGAPGQPELGIGAIADGGASYLDGRTIRALGVSREQIEAVTEEEERELERRVRAYRGDRPPLDVRDRTVILVDDGLATGVTARAAILALQKKGPARIVFAAPVCAPTTARVLARHVDEVVCVAEPEDLYAVGVWYDDFTQTTDEQVITILRRAWQEERDRRAHATDRWPREGADTGEWAKLAELPPRGSVVVDAGGVSLAGDLSVPERARGVVLFAHGSGSSRHSPRNRYVAGELERAGLATMLVDLLSETEEAIDQRTRHLRFDIGLLARRLIAVTDWLHAKVPELAIGYFGASTGAAAAIVAAAQRPEIVHAIVSRGGRPDLAGQALSVVRAPTLLVVGSADVDVIQLNREAMAQMRNVVKLELVPGATHLFEEPGTLTRAAQLARDWLLSYLAPAEDLPRTETA